MHPIIEKLKKRKLVQWALAYLAGAVALYSALEAVAGPWPITDAQLRIVQVLLVAGLLIALTVAWYHGERGEQRVTGIELLILAGIMGLGAIGIRLVTSGPAASLGAQVGEASRVTFTIPVGESRGEVRHQSRIAVVFSPTGDAIAYKAGWGPNERPLYHRALDDAEAQALVGTEWGYNPFYSPDGAWLAFFSADDGALKRIRISDGVVETIAQDPETHEGVRGASWGDDGSIVFAGAAGLYQVEASGGEPELLLPIPAATLSDAMLDDLVEAYPRYYQPHVVAGGRMILFHELNSGDPADAVIKVHDRRTRETSTLVEDAADPRIVRDDVLLFVRRGTLMAAKVDLRGPRVVGGPIEVLDNVMQAFLSFNTMTDTGVGQFATSMTGHLAYMTGGMMGEGRSEPIGVDRSGAAEALPDMRPRSYGYFRVSPDGTRLVANEGPTTFPEVWVHDLTTGVAQRIYRGGSRAVWSPDGDRLVFVSRKEGGMHRIRSDGAGGAERVLPPGMGSVSDWSSSGVIAYLDGGDIWLLPPDSDARPFFQSPDFESDATFSPDGNWVAYVSDRTDEAAVYVRPYPGPDPAYRISAGAGFNPAWSAKGDTLFFLETQSMSRRMMAVEIQTNGDFAAGRPVPLFEWTYGGRTPTRGYDLLADGRFITQRRVAGWSRPESGDEIQVVLNWLGDVVERLEN